MRKINFVCLLVLVSLFALTSCKNDDRPAFIEFRILETSDVHGAVFPYDFIRGVEANHSLAQVHSYVKTIRANPDLEILLLDNGDILQGQPTVYYSNFEDTDVPHICSQVMNYMGYEAATIGNHDIEAGHQVYDKLITEFEFPWLAANALDKSSGEPYFEPYTVINKKGIKIVVFGLITPGIPKWLPEKLWEGLEFIDMVETAKHWIPIILEDEKPDILVGLFHSGYDAFYGGSDTVSLNDNASLIVAENVPGFDVIFIGHDHQALNSFVTNIEGDKVLVLDPRSSARLISEARIVLSWDEEEKTYNKEIQGKLIETSNFSADEDFLNKFENEFKEIEAYVNRPVGIFEETVTSSSAMFGDSPFTDLIHLVQMDVSQSPISFAAPLSMNATIDSGEIYVKDLFQLYRFENYLYAMELTGLEIKNYLEYTSDLWFNTMKTDEDHLLRFRPDREANSQGSSRLYSSYYNFDSAEGINYLVDVSKKPGSRITIESLADGSEFRYDSIYRVAINSYRGNGGGGHLTVGAGISPDLLKTRIVFSTDKDLRYYMMKHIESSLTIHPAATNNWGIIPENWWKQGTKKDYNLLYEKN